MERPDTNQQENELERLAAKIKKIRIARKMTVRKLAEQAGTSASFISQLERGITRASTSSLMKISNALGIGMSDLFDESEGIPHKVLKKSQRPALPKTEGYLKTLLTQRPLQNLEVYVGEFEIDGSTGEEKYTHGNSQELMIVLRGIVEINLDEERYILEEGDSIEYATSTPHRIVNIGNSRAEVMWIISPPTSEASQLDQYKVWSSKV